MSRPILNSMELSGEMFEQLLAALRGDAPVGSKERRGSPRVGVRATIRGVLRQPDKQEIEEITLTLRDLSRNGLGLVHSQKVAIGSRFAVQLPNEGRPAITLLCTVANCRQMTEELWLLGASFTQVLSTASSRAAQSVIKTKNAALGRPASLPKTPSLPAAGMPSTHDPDLERRIRDAILS
jgi:hypothetical protein